ncbi:hypothetical protein QLQ12_39775 [Actinoplanes sp. NEAU-A12]|uniref:Uncharacterized protein n=1 Tax=Actinoplanes sandaracinus TaxID=3045177 RepID=A0ABT6WYD1_9ACTN|nr:hypothetical protein [Actinoplanes sandaracinus]MDI6104748.1 hypothetical protein [Actinoplanes sandaracinus]
MDMAAAPAGKARGRRVWLILALAVVLVAGVAVLTWPRVTTVKTMTATEHYGEDGGHVAVLKHVHAPLGTDHWEIVMGRDPSGGYGHGVRLDATGVDASSVVVEWGKDDATIVYGSGHRLTVPARFFTGGR